MSFKSKVSLDSYRTEGVSVFAGTGRGKAVAKAIKEEYGSDVEIVIPDDVIYISTSFKAGFKSVIPNVEFDF